jgi:excisionase family DNA binding protein
VPTETAKNITKKELLRPDEAAELLNVSRWTIYRWVKKGEIKATKIGRGSLRIFRESLEKVINDKRV